MAGALGGSCGRLGALLARLGAVLGLLGCPREGSGGSRGGSGSLFWKLILEVGLGRLEHQQYLMIIDTFGSMLSH